MYNGTGPLSYDDGTWIECIEPLPHNVLSQDAVRIVVQILSG